MVKETKLSKAIKKHFPEVSRMSGKKLLKELKDVRRRFEYGAIGRIDMYYEIAIGNELARRASKKKMKKVS